MSAVSCARSSAWRRAPLSAGFIRPALGRGSPIAAGPAASRAFLLLALARVLALLLGALVAAVMLGAGGRLVAALAGFSPCALAATRRGAAWRRQGQHGDKPRQLGPLRMAGPGGSTPPSPSPGLVMALLVVGSWAVTARLSEGETVSRWQVRWR
jgi:hypothetical protein